MAGRPSRSLLNGLNKDGRRSPSISAVPNSRKPSQQSVTSNPQNITVIPASTMPSAAPSPCSSSVQASPVVNGAHGGGTQPSNPAPLELPESLVSMNEALVSSTSKDGAAPSISRTISRKISSSARNGGRMLMRKTSNQAGLHAQARDGGLRDNSLGPNTRRRSDSTKADSRTMSGAASSDVPDYELAAQERVLTHLVTGLGISEISDGFTDLDSPISPSEEQVEAPTVPEGLVAGILALKVTKKLAPTKQHAQEPKDRKTEEQMGVPTKSVKGRKAIRLFVDAGGHQISWTVLEGRLPARIAAPWEEKRFLIDNIKEIFTGDDSAAYRQQYNSSGDEADRWCTIVYELPRSPPKSSEKKAINIVTRSRKELRFFVDNIQMMQRHRQELMMGLTAKDGLLNEKNIRFHWAREVKAAKAVGLTSTLEDGLDYPAVANLCNRLHIHLPKRTIQDRFDAADARSVGQLNYGEFKSFILSIEERQEFRPIYDAVRAGNSQGISLQQFLNFLAETQGVDMQNTWPDYWDARVFYSWIAMSTKMQQMKSSPPSSSVRLSRSNSATNVPDSSVPTGNEFMDFVAFASFMMSEACSIYQQAFHKPVYDRPLNEYYISSSHNTYLTGAQVLGESSVEPYITALRNGCRCIEIDCWDGSEGRPKVTHGLTLTTSIFFKDVISTIGRYAFVQSPLPLILSLEVHCNAQQQDSMATVMREILGPMLVLEPLDRTATTLPTPDQLTHKILVKVKPSGRAISEDRRATASVNRERSASSPWVLPSMPTDSVQPELSLKLASMQVYNDEQLPRKSYDTIYTTTTATTSSVPASISGEESDAFIAASPAPKAKPTRITEALGRMGIYLEGHSFHSFDAPAAHQFNHIFSLSEGAANDICRNPDKKAMFEDHNQRYMARVYPKGKRVDSSNFDPNIYWRRGVQMVAMNWQRHDQYMQMNQAMFAHPSDRAGYVLKPEYLRISRRINGNPNNRMRLSKYKVKFSVEVISAQRLPKLPKISSLGGVNPFIELQMFSAEDKTKGIATGTVAGSPPTTTDAQRPHGIGFPYTASTSVVLDNGYNPQWNKRIELALETKYPDLVFVRWIVWHSPTATVPADKRGCVQLAWFTGKLGSLAEGYRHLPLYAHNMEEFIYSTLFCKIRKEKQEFAGVAEDSGRGR